MRTGQNICIIACLLVTGCDREVATTAGTRLDAVTTENSPPEPDDSAARFSVTTFNRSASTAETTDYRVATLDAMLSQIDQLDWKSNDLIPRIEIVRVLDGKQEQLVLRQERENPSRLSAAIWVCFDDKWFEANDDDIQSADELRELAESFLNRDQRVTTLIDWDEVAED